MEKVQSSTCEKSVWHPLGINRASPYWNWPPRTAEGWKRHYYSRRITAHDRIIYDIYDDRVEVYVLEIEGHYDDK